MKPQYERDAIINCIGIGIGLAGWILFLVLVNIH